MAAEEAAGQLRSVRMQHQPTFLPQLDQFAAALDAEAAALTRERARMDSETEALKELAADIAVRRKTVSQKQTELTNVQRQLSDRRTTAGKLDAFAERQHDQVQMAKDVVARLEATRESIRLNCNGTTYDECRDRSAKAAFDRQLYDANMKLSAARRDYHTRAADLRKTRAERARLSPEMRALRVKALTLQAPLARERFELHQRTEQHATRANALIAAENAYRGLPAVHQRDVEVSVAARAEVERN